MRTKIAMTDTVALMSQTEADVGLVMSAAMADGTAALKQDWRDQIIAARLGARLAGTVQGRTYPQGRPSLDPATFVWTKAPGIIDAYARGATIVPVSGRRFLAIPTQDVPRKRRGNALTPREVEERFGRPLQFISPRDKGFHTPSIRRNGVAFLVLKGLTIRKATGRWRNASQRELARGAAGQKAISAVIMFILVPVVRVEKRLDLDLLAQRAQDRFAGLLAGRWSGLPSRAAPLKSR